MSAVEPWEPARWTGPRFAPYATLVARLARWSTWPTVAELDDALADHLRGDAGGPTVRLVEQAPAPRRRPPRVDADRLYEVQAAAGAVPTRPRNLHDLCNALVWATFPRAKLALTARLAVLQRARAGGRHMPGARTPEHDRLALLDEGGLIVAGPRQLVFGHAILEHAARGTLAVRAARLLLPAPAAAARDVLDRALATALVDGAAVEPGPGVAIDDAALAPA